MPALDHPSHETRNFLKAIPRREDYATTVIPVNQDNVFAKGPQGGAGVDEPGHPNGIIVHRKKKTK